MTGVQLFTLFVGFGLSSLIFGELLRFDFGIALMLFAAVELIAALLSFALFRAEAPSQAVPSASGATLASLTPDPDRSWAGDLISLTPPLTLEYTPGSRTDAPERLYVHYR